MKPRLLILAAALLATACAPKDPNAWTLKGEVKGFDQKAMLFVTDNLNLNPDNYTDLIPFVDGKMEYRGAVDHPMFGNIMYITPAWDTIWTLAAFTVEPGARLKLKGDISWPGNAKGYVTGNRTNDRLTAFLKNANEAIETRLTPENIDKWNEMSWAYIRENTDNMGGVFMLDRVFANSGDGVIPGGAEETLAAFSPEIRQLPVMIELGKTIEAIKEKERQFGESYREIVSAAPDGDVVILSDVIAANRYTLVDFWASWCKPCMAEMPHLREAYAAYHDKGFEIFAVSLDDNADAWKKAIADQKMTWLQVSSLHGWQEPAAQVYEVSSIPASFLIDFEGNIVARNLRGKELSDRLAELLP